MSLLKPILLSLLICSFTLFSYAQSSITIPQASPAVQITQTVGISDIHLSYSSPSVKEREIWGKIVPMDQVWRAGANQNTTIEFEHDVEIEGKSLPAGKYGLHMIPSSDAWTIIFSKNATSWGSYSYKEDEDALRVQVKAEDSPFQENLAYQFSNPSSHAAVLNLLWEKKRVPIKVAFDPSLLVENMRNELRSTAGFSWMGYYQAAQYCHQNDMNAEEAKGWVNQSIQFKPNFQNYSLLSQMLQKEGKAGEAEEAFEKGFAMGTEMELYQYGAALIGQGKNDEVLPFFERLEKKSPDHWITHAGLAAGNRINGNLKKALGHYKQAHEGAPANWKPSLESRIKQVETSLAESKTAKR